jgi:hypothetical protein
VGDTTCVMSEAPKPTLSRPRVLRPVFIGLALLAFAAGLVAFIAVRASDPKSGIRVSLGDNEFRVGDIDRIAAEIGKNGPLLFAGLVGPAQTRPLGLYHDGTDPAKGWRAFSLATSNPSCVLALDRKTYELVDPCSGTRYPPDGGSLPTYPTRIDDQRVLYVDLTPGGLPGQGTTTVAAPTTPAVSTTVAATSTSG